MTTRLSRWGVGPRIFSGAFGALIFAAAATYHWPEVCRVYRVPRSVAVTIAMALFVIGIVLWLAGVVSVMKAYNRDQLVTSGVYRLVRHPIYSAWIVLILPGVAFLARSWPLLLVPLVAYAAFKLLIHREDDNLRERYGQAYVDYRAQVNELIPIPRFRTRVELCR